MPLDKHIPHIFNTKKRLVAHDGAASRFSVVLALSLKPKSVIRKKLLVISNDRH